MNENPSCELCNLHHSAHERSVCLKGEGSGTARLVIFLDAPTLIEDRRHRGFVSEAAELLRYFLRRMSINPQLVYFDYVIKCFPTKDQHYGKKAYRLEYIEACSIYRIATLQLIKPKAIIGMGSKCCEAFLGSDKVASYEGTNWIPLEPLMRDYVERVWITYNPAYALEQPAESVSIYRTLWAAAEEAGLSPKLDKHVKPFNYG